MELLRIFLLVAFILGLVATVLALIFIVPEKKRPRLNKFGKFLHDTVNFKYLIIEKLLQALYIFSTATIFLLGFLMLFYVDTGYSSYYYSYRPQWYGGYGMLIMLLGPLVVRLMYEALMMVILLIKNVIQINGKLKAEEDPNKVDIFSGPEIKKKHTFCNNCGTKVKTGSFCANCGTKLE